MKLFELTIHQDITTWVEQAIPHVIEDVCAIMVDEFNTDREWFVTRRYQKLRQLCTEILTIKLIEVSSGKWAEQDFEGEQHSTLISSAIQRALVAVQKFYHKLTTERTGSSTELPQHTKMPAEPVYPSRHID